jgi:hypothetical protein
MQKMFSLNSRKQAGANHPVYFANWQTIPKTEFHGFKNLEGIHLRLIRKKRDAQVR